jgi:hypothetical protein
MPKLRRLMKILRISRQEKPWGQMQINPRSIRERVLNIGVPTGSMTAEQVLVFEQIGKRAQQLGVKIKVTVIE